MHTILKILILTHLTWNCLGLGLVLGLREGWLAGFPETKLGPKVLQCCN